MHHILNCVICLKDGRSGFTLRYVSRQPQYITSATSVYLLLPFKFHESNLTFNLLLQDGQVHILGVQYSETVQATTYNDNPGDSDYTDPSGEETDDEG